MNVQTTFVAIKPDAVSRSLIGEVIARLERAGLQPKAMELKKIATELAEEHYAEHKDKPFFGDLVDFITGGHVVIMAWQGPAAISKVRQLVGATDPLKADPGSIRGAYGNDIQCNLVHASDSPESAARELKLFFPDGEFVI